MKNILSDRDLTNKEESICENCGIAGALISLACLGQHLILMSLSWVAYVVIAIYVIQLLGFIFLIRKSDASIALLIIGTFLIFLFHIYMIMILSFSFVLSLLTFYSVIVLPVFLGSDIPGKLRNRKLMRKVDAEIWKHKIY